MFLHISIKITDKDGKFLGLVTKLILIYLIVCLFDKILVENKTTFSKQVV